MVEMKIGVDGMMCSMCESHMNDAIRQNFEVKKVSSSHREKMTRIVAKEVIAEEKIKQVVEKLGYQLTGYEVGPYEKKGMFSKLFQ